MKKYIRIVGLLVLAVVTLFFILPVESKAESVNLFLNKSVESSGHEDASFSADKAVDGINSRVKPHSRWASALGTGEKWLKVDLGKEQSLESFVIDWERRNAQEYTIEVSNDNKLWQTVYKGVTEPADFRQEVILDEEVSGRYFKLVISKFISDCEGVDWNNVSVFEFEGYGEEKEDGTLNLALNKQSWSSGNETANFSAAKAFDGDSDRNKSPQSRWASTVGRNPKWLKVDLGKARTMQTFILDWERRNAFDYTIQISDDDLIWQTVFTGKEHTLSYKERIILEQPVTGRYVKVVVSDFEPNYEGVNWATVSLYEFEMYANVLPPTLEEEAETLKMPVQVDGEANLKLPELANATVELYGADYKYVVTDEGVIHRPLVDTEIAVNLKITRGDQEIITEELPVVIPGEYRNEESKSAKPTVIPELREWLGKEGQFEMTDSTRLVIAEKDAIEFQPFVEEFQTEYHTLFGRKAEIVVSNSPEKGDIYFEKDGTANLGKEGYRLDIDEYVHVVSSEKQGAIWATKSIAQILKQESFINKGLVRDYPKWEIRGFVLDVGRKTFSLDYVKQIALEMSWYKMNDFQIHLNDNYIFLEDYSRAGEDPFDAYSGYRLESNVAGLTSKDMSYSKAEFREFIVNARNIGVNIVPEIDVPAHSLAFTQIRPDLALGTVGRDADHFDLRNPETLPFIKGVFGEYMTQDNPVFDEMTTVHAGTDEYSSAYTEEFRKFTDDMIKFVRDEKERQVRIWGSLSARNGKTPVSSTNVQMNIWNNGWANPVEMLAQGYDLINTNDGTLYMVPGAGYYNDYLNVNNIFNNWEANKIGGTRIPAGSPQMKGAAFAVWNDHIDKREGGISELDVYDRINHAMPTLALKMWGKSKEMTQEEFKKSVAEIGITKRSNIRSEVASVDETVLKYTFDTDKAEDKSGNDYHSVKLENVEIKRTDNSLQLKGGKSFIETPLTDLAVGHTLQFKVLKEAGISADSEQVLFEAEVPAGKTAIKLSQKKTGKIGFSREGNDYTFNYSLPENQWVNVGIYTELNKTYLFIDGKQVDMLEVKKSGTDIYISKRATLLLPLNRIGSATDAFLGEIKNVKVVKGKVLENEEIDIPVKSIKLDVSDLTTIKVGKQKQITVSFEPENATNKIVKWEVEKNNLLEVSSTGEFKALKSGITKVTAESANGIKKTVVVRVTK